MKYKCFRPVGRTGDIGKWRVGKWRTTRMPIAPCGRGFHASETPIDALWHVRGEILAIVDVRGDSILFSPTQQVWSQMIVRKAYCWTKRDGAELAIFATESVLNTFASRYPADSGPRKAVEAAKACLAHPRGAFATAAMADAYAAYDAADYQDAVAANIAWAAIHTVSAACADDAYAAHAACAAYGYAAAVDDGITAAVNDWMIDRIPRLSEVGQAEL